MDVSERVLEPVNLMQRLGENEAIEDALRHTLTGLKVADQVRRGIARDYVEHVRLGDFFAAETHGVFAIANLQDASSNRLAVLGEKFLDEIAVDRFAAFETETARDRRRPAQIAEPNRLRAEPPEMPVTTKTLEERPRKERLRGRFENPFHRSQKRRTRASGCEGRTSILEKCRLRACLKFSSV